MIASFSEEQQQGLKNDNGVIEVKCQFCNKSYDIK
jgi:redox-regulated HSP33 family molecular chaperone